MVKNQDQYGRNVAVCSLGAGGEDLNAWLVSNGYAVAYRWAGEAGLSWIPALDSGYCLCSWSKARI